jgi:hypothetical protein
MSIDIIELVTPYNTQYNNTQKQLNVDKKKCNATDKNTPPTPK